MITGRVNADREAVIRLPVRGPTGQEQVTEAVIDTGFDSSLSLPSSVIKSLELVWRQRARVLLADGSEGLFDEYEATVVWDGRSIRVPVDEADTAPSVGMSLLDGHELTIEVRPSGQVTIVAMQPQEPPVPR